MSFMARIGHFNWRYLALACQLPCKSFPKGRVINPCQNKVRANNPPSGGWTAGPVFFNPADQVLDWSQRQSHGWLCWSQPAFLIISSLPQLQNEKLPSCPTCVLAVPIKTAPPALRVLATLKKSCLSSDNWTTLHRSQVPGQWAPGGQRSFDSMTLR